MELMSLCLPCEIYITETHFMTQHGDVQKFEGSKEREILFSLLRHKNY